MELIKIDVDTTGKQTVNARRIHEFLEIGKDFSDWIKDQIKRAKLVENRDYVINPEKGEYKKPRLEYHLVMRSAQHVSMMSGSDKGSEVRDYFIDCEERAKNPLAAIADPQTRALIQLLADNDAIKQEQAQHRTMIEHVSTKIDAITPKLTSASLNTIQGAISHTAKIYRQAQSVKHIKVSVPESTEYFRLLIHEKFNVSDIGYLSDIRPACKFLQAEAKKHQGEYNDWFSRNNLFSRQAA